MAQSYSFLLALSGLLMLAGSTWAQSPTFMFTAYTTGAVGKPNALTVADVNGDNILDAIICNGDAKMVGVLLGNGNGTFQSVITLSTGANSYPVGMAVADVNGDTKADLLVANLSQTVGVLLGNSNGTFQPMVIYSAGFTTSGGSGPFQIAATDVNGDGKPDLLTANGSDNTIGVFLNNGAGGFHAPVRYYSGSGSTTGATVSTTLQLVLGDVNNDGIKDVLTIIRGNPEDKIGVLLGNSTGAFTPITPLSLGVAPSGFEHRAQSLAVADTNGDGNLDVFTANDPTGMGSVLLGNGNGSFQPANVFNINWSGTFNSSSSLGGLVVADITSDGQPDYIVAEFGYGDVYIAKGNGSGGFVSRDTYSTGPNSHPSDVFVADVNRDNKLDIITRNYGSSTVGVLLNTTPLPTRATLPGTTATLTPNPATAATMLNLSGLPIGTIQVQAMVFDATGREISRHALVTSQGAAHAELPTAGLAPGLYMVRLLARNSRGEIVCEVIAQRLIVQ